MRLTHVLFLRVQKAAFCKESFVVACLTYKNVQCFWNGPVHKFYDLKASQMSKVRATCSSHRYPHVEKNQESSKVRQTTSNWIVTIKCTQ